MSWLYSRALVVASLGENSSDGEQSAQLNVMPTPQQFWRNDKMMEASKLSQFGLTLQLLTENRGKELLMLYLGGFPVRTYPQQERELASGEKEVDCGLKWSELLGKYDQNSYSWRTSQCSLLADLELSLEIWPKWGSVRNGVAYQRPPLEPRIYENESGSLLGTPTATMSVRSDKFREGRQPNPMEFAQQIPNNENFFHTPNTGGLDGGSNGRRALKKRLAKGWGWPTPTTRSRCSEGQVLQMRTLVEEGKLTKEEAETMLGGSLTPARMEQWRTPSAQETGISPERLEVDKDGELGGMTRHYDKDTGRLAQIGLTQQVDLREKFPTPNTMDSLPSRSYEAMKRQATNGGRKNRKAPGNLRERLDPLMCQAYDEARMENNPQILAQTLMWPTPSASQARSEGMIGQMRKKVEEGEITLEEAEQMISGSLTPKRMKRWPTPMVDDSKNVTRDSGCINTLVREVRNWPTPRTRGLLGGSGSREMVRAMVERGEMNEEQASEMMGVTMFPTPGANEDAAGQPGSKMQVMLGNCEAVRDSGKGTLNPSWTEWLMGWPVHWTDLGEVEIGWNEIWEDEPLDVPRVSTGVKERVSRLRAIGNGQVPLCAATAWKLLMERL